MDDLPHILVVDDDRRIRNLLQSFLVENGFRISVAASVAREKMAIVAFDLVVLDVMMPGRSGLSLTQSLRAEGSRVPVLMLSALAEAPRTSPASRRGSDDYLIKYPRRANSCSASAAPAAAAGTARTGPGGGEGGPFMFHMQRGELRKRAELVRLTSREQDFLRTLAASAGTPVARAELASEGSEEGARSVDVQINRLRQKIEEDPSNPRLPANGAGHGLCAACRLRAPEKWPGKYRLYARFNASSSATCRKGFSPAR